MRSPLRLQFEYGHRRKNDRVPQITALFKRVRRRAHWHIEWGKIKPERIGVQLVGRAPRACRPKGSLPTEQSLALVKPGQFTRGPEI